MSSRESLAVLICDLAKRRCIPARGIWVSANSNAAGRFELLNAYARPDNFARFIQDLNAHGIETAASCAMRSRDEEPFYPHQGDPRSPTQRNTHLAVFVRCAEGSQWDAAGIRKVPQISKGQLVVSLG